MIEELRRSDAVGNVVVLRAPAAVKSRIDVWGPPRDVAPVMQRDQDRARSVRHPQRRQGTGLRGRQYQVSGIRYQTGINDVGHHRIPDPALINQCVHCGFCLPTCPTYMLWGEEMDSPRGRIYLMKAASRAACRSTRITSSTSTPASGA